jgi:hypothetical protein
MKELVSHMPEEEQKRYENYGHLRIEAAFVNRIFIAYKPTGLTRAGKHKAPEIVNLIKVLDFEVDPRHGSIVTLKDQQTEQEQTVHHVPRRVYGYPIFVSIPTNLALRWDARLVNGRVWRSLSFALLIKTRNRADFYSYGNTYMEAPNVFRRLYPEVTGQFTF